ncbi:transposable element Tcb1 transposase [Trichonephila clavipes]|nr:transposable element Tcb1 transposase [Trichonephila clavipes]
MRAHMLKRLFETSVLPNICNFFTWPAYSPYTISPIEHVWDFVDRLLARDSCPAASKDELLLRVQAIWNSLPQADI